MNLRAWRLWRKPLRCNHARVRGVYGDEINYAGGARLKCLDCRAYLPGPLEQATVSHKDYLAMQGIDIKMWWVDEHG